MLISFFNFVSANVPSSPNPALLIIISSGYLRSFLPSFTHDFSSDKSHVIHLHLTATLSAISWSAWVSSNKNQVIFKVWKQICKFFSDAGRCSGNTCKFHKKTPFFFNSCLCSLCRTASAIMKIRWWGHEHSSVAAKQKCTFRFQEFNFKILIEPIRIQRFYVL